MQPVHSLDGGDGAVVDPGLDLSCVKLRQLRGYAVSPSAIAQLFTVETCSDGTPVPGLSTNVDGGTAVTNFDIVEDNAPLSSEANAQFQTSKGLRIYVSLVLDMSSSTHEELPQLIDASKAFVDELLVRRKLTNVLIGIDLFDGSPTANEWLLPISDPDRIKAKIDDLATYAPLDPSSTNLYGGVIDAVTKLQQRQVHVMSANDNGVVTVGYAVLFTDGADTAARVPKAQAVATLAATRFVDPGSMEVQATVATYAVPLAGKDYTPGSLEELLSGTTSGRAAGSGDAGSAGGVMCNDLCAYAKNGTCDDGTKGSITARCLPGTDCADCRKSIPEEAGVARVSEKVDGTRFVLQADSAAALKQRFSDVAARISRQLDGTYLLAYCSPKRTGKHTLRLDVTKSVSPNSTGYEFEFIADGFGPGCSTQYFTDICSAKQCGGFNCGACNEETDVCNVQTDQCENACTKQNACGGATIMNTFGYQQVCKADPGIKQCGLGCIDVSTDPTNCGDCGVRCPSTTTCTSGKCVCPDTNQTACPNGCFDLATDASNCGVCGNYCPSGLQCVGGVCDCTGGQTGCFGSCVDLTTNQANCGKCGNRCPAGSSCSGSSCTCANTSLTACTTGCVDVTTDSRNCGKCGNACGTAVPCSAGKCASCTDTAIPGTATFVYKGTATAVRSRGASCTDGADGTALSWTPSPGIYMVTLTGGSSISGEIFAGCDATDADYCLSNGTATQVVVNSGSPPFVFFIRQDPEAGASSPFSLTVTASLIGP